MCDAPAAVLAAIAPPDAAINTVDAPTATLLTQVGLGLLPTFIVSPILENSGVLGTPERPGSLRT
jgi:hypothetical protein